MHFVHTMLGFSRQIWLVTVGIDTEYTGLGWYR